MNVHEGHRARMRQQIEQFGMDSLSDVQFLEVALYPVIPRGDTNELAHRLLTRFESLSGVLEANRAFGGRGRGRAHGGLSDAVFADGAAAYDLPRRF